MKKACNWMLIFVFVFSTVGYGFGGFITRGSISQGLTETLSEDVPSVFVPSDESLFRGLISAIGIPGQEDGVDDSTHMVEIDTQDQTYDTTEPNIDEITENGFFQESADEMLDLLEPELEQTGISSLTKMPFDISNITTYVVPEENAATEYVSGEIIIKFKSQELNLKSNRGMLDVKQFAKNNSMLLKEQILDGNLAVMQVEEDSDIYQRIDELSSDPDVEYAQPNYIYTFSSIPNDPEYTKQRGLPNIEWEQGMDVFSGNVSDSSTTGTLVAVIDGGVYYSHSDLQNNMRNGEDCVDFNGAYLGGCKHGFDFSDNDKDPLPSASNGSHGTHIAGIIAAEMNNTIGIVGVNPHANIMAIRVSRATSISITKGIAFAKYNGAKIINGSFGTPSNDTVMSDAIQSFGLSGGLFIASAGNAGANHDAGIHNYPCDFDLDNIICVGALTNNPMDNMAGYSDYGPSYVDISAPGGGQDMRDQIYSTVVGFESVTGIYESFDGIADGSMPAGWQTAGLEDFNLSSWGITSSKVFTGITPSNRGIYNTQGNGVLYADTNTPYAGGANSFVRKRFDMSEYGSTVGIEFTTVCDTEYTNVVNGTGGDYMKGFYSNRKSGYGGVIPSRNEFTIDTDGDPTGNAAKRYTATYSPSSPGLVNGLIIGFLRRTNLNDNQYDGCGIDDVVVTKYVPSEGYGLMAGTSMAAPHVAGLASLAWSMRPDLDYAQIKQAILDNGTILPALVGGCTPSGCTLTNKKINVYNTLKALYSGSTEATGLHLYLNGRFEYLTTGSPLFSGAIVNVSIYNDDGTFITTVQNPLHSAYFPGSSFFEITNLPSKDISVFTMKSMLESSGNIVGDPFSSYVNPTDALTINKYFIKSITLSGLYLKAADVNGDGKANPTDALITNKYFVKLINKFTVGSYVFEERDIAVCLSPDGIINTVQLDDCRQKYLAKSGTGARPNPIILIALPKDGTYIAGSKDTYLDVDSRFIANDPLYIKTLHVGDVNGKK